MLFYCEQHACTSSKPTDHMYGIRIKHAMHVLPVYTAYCFSPHPHFQAAEQLAHVNILAQQGVHVLKHISDGRQLSQGIGGWLGR